MAKSITDSYSGFLDIMLDGDKYVDRLDEKSKKKAKEELNENPKEIDNAVKQFRTWIQQQPHYTVCTDKIFLLAFLRRCKYSQLEARQMFDIFHSATYKHLTSWMVDIKVDEPGLKKICSDCKSVVLLPDRDDQGRRIILWRAASFETGKKTIYNPDTLFALWGFTLMLTQRESMTQVNGYVLIQDGTGQTMKHMSYFGLERFKHVIKVFYNNFPARIKQVHYYNMGPVFEAFMALVRPVLSKKIQDRFVTHTSMETVYKHVPMKLLPQEYLPDEYKGPSPGTIDQISKNFYTKVCSKEIKDRIWQLSHTQFKVDESKRPAGKDVPTAAFRKLNVD